MSIRLKSRQQCPVNGFQFVDPAISPEPLQTWDFEELVRLIADRRALNPRFQLTTDPAAIRAEADLQNAMRMMSIRGAESYIINDGGPGANPSRAPHISRWPGVVGGARNVVAGAAILKDWLGAGGVPVAVQLAASRSAVCAVCPKRVPGDWTTLFTRPVAERIKRQIEKKHELKLETPSDGALKDRMCEACTCPLELKPWTPLAHILAHQSDDTKARLDVNCWVLKE